MAKGFSDCKAFIEKMGGILWRAVLRAQLLIVPRFMKFALGLCLGLKIRWEQALDKGGLRCGRGIHFLRRWPPRRISRVANLVKPSLPALGKGHF
jgi:hypothetical protein